MCWSLSVSWRPAARELARLLVAPVSGVRKAIAALERDGLVSRGRLVGAPPVVQLNPTYFAREALEAYLLRLAEADLELQVGVRVAPAPRQSGKPL